MTAVVYCLRFAPLPVVVHRVERGDIVAEVVGTGTDLLIVRQAEPFAMLVSQVAHEEKRAPELPCRFERLSLSDSPSVKRHTVRLAPADRPRPRSGLGLGPMASPT